MIEYYQFKHNGGRDEYKDAIFLSIVPSMTFAVLYGSGMEDGAGEALNVLSKVFAGDEVQLEFDKLDKLVFDRMPKDAQYMLLRIKNESVECSKYGGVSAKIVMGGEMRLLPNGYFGLNAGDRIVCGTDNFIGNLSDEAIIADALVAENSSEWMNYMVRRISDINELTCGNLTALTLKVKA
ncbi:MAG: hypothetical protein K5745_07895 [Saccharofermentans sp.]|nr:hypothetical protein [Saccharofermentans sp.]